MLTLNRARTGDMVLSGTKGRSIKGTPTVEKSLNEVAFESWTKTRDVTRFDYNCNLERVRPCQ